MQAPIKWVNANGILLFSTEGDFPGYPKKPDLTKEMKRAFGETPVDVMTRCKGKTTAKDRETLQRMFKWQKEHPKMVAHWEKLREINEDWQREYPTFQGGGNLKPGVLIELEDGRHFLIGDIDPTVCDGDIALGNEPPMRVRRYAVLVEPKEEG